MVTWPVERINNLISADPYCAIQQQASRKYPTGSVTHRFLAKIPVHTAQVPSGCLQVTSQAAALQLPSRGAVLHGLVDAYLITIPSAPMNYVAVTPCR